MGRPARPQRRETSLGSGTSGKGERVPRGTEDRKAGTSRCLSQKKEVTSSLLWQQKWLIICMSLQVMWGKILEVEVLFISFLNKANKTYRYQISNLNKPGCFGVFLVEKFFFFGSGSYLPILLSHWHEISALLHTFFMCISVVNTCVCVDKYRQALKNS